MISMLSVRARLGIVAAVAVPATVMSGVLVSQAAPSAPAPAAPSTASDRTSTAEARRVDRVAATLDWFDCTPLTIDGSAADCATATLPLDYDRPQGATTDVAVLRLRARDPKNRIGSLFVNPGGPSGSEVEIAAFAAAFLSPAVLDRFDIVGFDPRGTNLSSPVRCWKDLGQQAKALSTILSVPFPVSPAQTTAYVAESRAFGKACATTGKPISSAMSTAQVARDMDVLRRALGDSKLTYLGFSYGSYLGTVYANLFPDRVRALAVDGVVDPVAWAGTTATRGTPLTARIKSGQGGDRALRELLVRCGEAGPARCSFAELGDPVANYEALAATVKAATGTPRTEEWGFDYPVMMGFLLGDLYSPAADLWVDFDLSLMWAIVNGTPAEVAEGTTALTARRSAAARVAQARKDFRAKLATLRKAPGLAVDWPYDNTPEAFQSVVCTDGLEPADAASWPRFAATQDRLAPGFGPLWTWSSAPCATRTWTAQDEDTYPGPFTRRTSSPVLVVGSYWDPATNYDSAVSLAKLLPNSRLLASDNWGHTAYGTSACATQATDQYLLTLALPAPGTVCVGDSQPYPPVEDGGPSPSASPSASASPSPSAAARALPGQSPATGSDVPEIPELPGAGSRGRRLPPIQPVVPGVVPLR